MRTRRKKRNLLPTLIVVLVILCIIFTGATKVLTLTGHSLSSNVFHAEELDPTDIYSQNVILTDAENGTELFGKNETAKCYPASLTKIMTVLVAIESIDDLDKTVKISGDSIEKLQKENASMAGYRRGEKTTVKDLLYGSMLASGAEASAGLARASAGSIDKFVKLMNDKASELNMEDTHFTNPTGLHNDKQVSSPKDMSILLRHALENSYFKKVFTAKKHVIKTDERKFTVQSTYFSSCDDSSGNYKVLGAKTGTTSNAGSCLASYVEKKGMKLILITMCAPIVYSQQPYSFDDLDYVFSSI